MQAGDNVNISAFSCSDDILGPDFCEGSRTNNQMIDRQSLRLPESSK